MRAHYPNYNEVWYISFFFFELKGAEVFARGNGGGLDSEPSLLIWSKVQKDHRRHIAVVDGTTEKRERIVVGETKKR